MTAGPLWWCGAILAILSAPVTAYAQTAPPRFLISVGGGAQTTGDDISDRREFEVNIETAAIESRHPFQAGGLFDAGVDVRLWGGLGAGLSVTYVSASSDIDVDARIPHPFQFNAHRAISGTTTGARRSETGVHPHLFYLLPLGGRLRGSVFAGPSFLSAEQDLVRDVRYDEAFPYDTATFVSADLAPASGSGVGFNAGGDVFWLFTNRFGAGALVRFTRAALDLDAPAERTVPFEAGGVHVAVGVRAVF